jgi:hypothetical protein
VCSFGLSTLGFMPLHITFSSRHDPDRTFPALRPILKLLIGIIFLQFVALVYGIVSKVPFEIKITETHMRNPYMP